MRIRELQRSNNLETKSSWAPFSGHRDRVTSVLRNLAGSRSGELGVIGAGNCNDFDLSELCKMFKRIELVDVDAEALQFAIQNQSVKDSRIVLQNGVDVTGVGERMSEWRPDKLASRREVAACIEATSNLPPDFQARYDVTVSVGVLSQLIDCVISTLGDRHESFLSLLTAIRTQHLRFLLEATKPGGTVFLGADVVSSLTCPQIQNADRADYPNILTAALAERNFFTGMNPFILYHVLTEDQKLSALSCTVVVGKPWLWDQGARSYLLVPFIITRA